MNSVPGLGEFINLGPSMAMAVGAMLIPAKIPKRRWSGRSGGGDNVVKLIERAKSIM